MKISIGADHRGFALKQFLQKEIQDVSWIDVGAHDKNRSDYPLFAQAVSHAIASGQAAAGVLICGSGIGMAIAANRYKKMYAAVCLNEQMARIAKEDEGANILVLPSDFVTNAQALAIFKVWQEATFKGGRYAQRLDLLDSMLP